MTGRKSSPNKSAGVIAKPKLFSYLTDNNYLDRTKFITEMKSFIPFACSYRSIQWIASVLLIALSSGFIQAQAPSFWTDAELSPQRQVQIETKTFRALELDQLSLRSTLENASLMDQIDPTQSSLFLTLPLPEGGEATFKIAEAPVMAAELQARFPGIRSYKGVGIDDQAQQVHFDLTPAGFHAMIFRNGSTVFIDPSPQEGLPNLHISYTREAFYKGTSKTWEGCEVGEEVTTTTPQVKHQGNFPIQMGMQRFPSPTLPFETESGNELRTYRLALACTGEYAAFHGGTIEGALAAMNTSMVRINGVFERDVAIRMVMVANNDQLIFLDSGSDPYTNNSGGTMLDENIATCNGVIGSANYDIGHVFSTGGGGVAILQSPCGNNKAGGVTGQGSPVGDPFDIDYVCHEMGHQFGGNHTQNNSCNRSSGAAFEPGSASTIMGYAGICSPNLQSNSDDHFHNHSYNEMIAFSVNGNGNNCATITSTGNTPPTVEAGTNGLTIPASTPFELTATGNDSDGGEITYNWEEYDLGPETASGDNDLTNPSGNQPIFRSWPSSSEPTRIFPKVDDLVNGTVTIGEHLPTYSRNLNFKCTVRDNQLNGGGVADDLLTMSVDGESGPFVVNSPNGGESVAGGVPYSVDWDVAGTNSGAVDCANVDIYLSIDGGYTWPYTLISNTSNDGWVMVTLPNVLTTNARLKVKGSNHVFFDISNGNFTIEPTTNIEPYDAIASTINGVGAQVCGTAISPGVVVINLGTETLTSFAVVFDLDNGMQTGIVDWTGSLAFGESIVVNLCGDGELCMDVPSGDHALEVSIHLTGQTDANEGNNSISTSFESGCFDSCSNCGCTDETACNFEPDATLDDGNCIYQDPCSCELTGEQSASLNANETSEPLTQSATSLSELTTISIELEFNNAGSTNSWAADLAMAITSPSGQCASFGGYNSSPGGCSSLGNYGVVWPSSWATSTNGLYTATVDLSPASLSGSGDWSVVLYNGYSSSAGAEYAVTWVIDNLCLDEEGDEGCTDAEACNYDAEAVVDDGSCLQLNACGECDIIAPDADGDGLADCNETTTFTGNIDVSWNESGNWSNGVPSTHDAIVIPDGSTVVIYTAAVIPTGSTMTNDGALTVNGSFLNEGSMINYNNLTSIGTINNSGDFMNVGTITNYGTLGNESLLVNDGSIYTCEGVFVNTGTLMNNGTIYVMTTWYQDDDGDGAGDPNSSVEACSDSPPAGFVDIAGDECPFDSDKTEPGLCGCGIADTDADGDGIADCNGLSWNELLPDNANVECDQIPDAAILSAWSPCEESADVDYFEVVMTGFCVNDYEIIRTWTASDSCLNTIIHVQTIYVTDSTPPVFEGELPSDVTVECDDIPQIPVVTASDNCTGSLAQWLEIDIVGTMCSDDYAIIRTWFAQDQCSNSSTFTHTIWVVDTTPPIWDGDQLPQGGTANCDDLIEVIANAPEMTATDNCSEYVEVTLNHFFTQLNLDDCDTGDFLTRTWTAIDGCGNLTIHEEVITMLGDEIGCPEDLNGNGSVEVGDLLLLLADFGCFTECSADIDGDGAVTVNDILLLLAAFGDSC